MPTTTSGCLYCRHFAYALDPDGEKYSMVACEEGRDAFPSKPCPDQEQYTEKEMRSFGWKHDMQHNWPAG